MDVKHTRFGTAFAFTLPFAHLGTIFTQNNLLLRQDTPDELRIKRLVDWHSLDLNL